jgi:serine protease Do
VLVMTVARGSIADQAGIEAGDVVTAVNGEKVKTDDDLFGIVADHKVGDVLTFDIVRGDQTGSVKMKLPPPNK